MHFRKQCFIHRDDVTLEPSNKKNAIVRMWHSVWNFFRRFGKKKVTVSSPETNDNADDNQIENSEVIEENKNRIIPCIDD